tara:strand:+ start:1387 stop:1917 length:531 start_codon:yes stop_codon:yes gene_type:complete
MSNAPEVNSFVSVVEELAKTDKDTVSARIAKILSASATWPPQQIDTHLTIRWYQKSLESFFPGRQNRGGLGYLWNEAYKRCEHTPQQIDIEEQIAEQQQETPARINQPYTEAQNMQIKQLFEMGLSDEQIAAELCRTKAGIGLQRLKLDLLRSPRRDKTKPIAMTEPLPWWRRLFG